MRTRLPTHAHTYSHTAPFFALDLLNPSLSSLIHVYIILMMRVRSLFHLFFLSIFRYCCFSAHHHEAENKMFRAIPKSPKSRLDFLNFASGIELLEGRQKLVFMDTMHSQKPVIQMYHRNVKHVFISELLWTFRLVDI
ncbi:hypothetical protein BX666DRAFT_2132204 [Dichotomocladium elegans]|nr:hypothetical protein BX666DRAFT_2132204 [Dichotomocladium elegans]